MRLVLAPKEYKINRTQFNEFYKQPYNIAIKNILEGGDYNYEHKYIKYKTQ
jgi:hypothetical protein